ncbi:hypothetical protein PG999_008074 [Apiospora kogelbergensis]|uniref:Amidohydrolase-related domain-containing protein n=1 Tax=Apiospora kogelbergensis TaxID=1337665 RepID=A0AAW0QNX4_9PEZI
MAPSSVILLQGGTLLLHNESNHIAPTTADLLIIDSLISRIGPDLLQHCPENTRVVDCRDKIISPGFVDTHRHLWQTQYKGAHDDHGLVPYIPRGNFTATLWSPEDLFWGSWPSIDAGTTTVVDHSHCNPTPDHPQAAIQALVSSGLRAVYCFTPARRLVSLAPLKVEDDTFSEESLSIYRALAKAGPFGGSGSGSGNGGDGDGRVHMGYANDSLYAPADVLKRFYADLRDPAHGRPAKVITSHALGGALTNTGAGRGGPTAVQVLHSHGLLGPDVLLAHATSPHDVDADLYRASGACVSSTPNTELQMGLFPVALRPDHYDHASLGVDCHSWGVPGIPGQMRMMLQAARFERGEWFASQGLWSRDTGFAAEQVFNLGTLGGARAAGLQGEVGSLKVGMKADILVFDTDSPGMLAAASENPVAAIVLHSNPSDIEMVIVDGVVRKEGGKLLDTRVTAAPVEEKSVVSPGTTLSWKAVARKILDSQHSLKTRAKGMDFEADEEVLIDMMHLSRETMVKGIHSSSQSYLIQA